MKYLCLKWMRYVYEVVSWVSVLCCVFFKAWLVGWGREKNGPSNNYTKPKSISERCHWKIQLYANITYFQSKFWHPWNLRRQKSDWIKKKKEFLDRRQLLQLLKKLKWLKSTQSLNVNSVGTFSVQNEFWKLLCPVNTFHCTILKLYQCVA